MFAVPALHRYRAALLVFSVIPIALGLGTYQVVRNSCGYCEDRSLLPIAPALVYLVALGIGLVGFNLGRIARGIAIGASGLLALLAGLSAGRSYQRFSTDAYFLPIEPIRTVLAAAPDHQAAVLVEGFGEGLNAPAEEAFVYEIAAEQTGGRVSIEADKDDRGGLNYLGTSPLEPPIFRSGYKYVLTLLPGIETKRRVIARAPGVALEQRASGLDVSLDYGAEVPNVPNGASTGVAWVYGPLQFVVTGQRGSPSFVTVIFALTSPSSVVSAQKGVTIKRQGTRFVTCLPTSSAGPTRVADITLAYASAVRILSMTASRAKCG
jgi:hypothetical protein